MAPKHFRLLTKLAVFMPITVLQLFQTHAAEVKRRTILRSASRPTGSPFIFFVILIRKSSASFTASAVGNNSATPALGGPPSLRNFLDHGPIGAPANF
jgi:hypothetical protein